MLKVGVDFHGVITSNPIMFAELMNMLVNIGSEVHLMTGSRRRTFDKEVKTLGIKIPFTHFFSIADTLIDLKADVDLTDPDNPRCTNKVLWDRQKGLYALEADLDLMIDDEPDYAQYFSTPFSLYKGEKNINLFPEYYPEDVRKS